MPRAKKKAQETQVSEDDISEDDSAQTLPAKSTTSSKKPRTTAPSNTVTRRERKKSSKQEKLEFEALQKLAAKLERENKALKRSQAQDSGKRATVRIRTPPAASQLVNDNDSDTGDANVENDDGDFSPEEEDTGFDTFQSPFQSQGTIQVTQPPLKRLTRRVNDPKTPVIATNTRQERSSTPGALPARAEFYARSSSPPQPYDYRHSRHSSRATVTDLQDTAGSPLQDAHNTQVALYRARNVGEDVPAPGEEPRRRGRAPSSIESQVQRQHKRPRITPSTATPPTNDLDYKRSVKPVLSTRAKEGDYSGVTAKIIARSIVRYELKVLTEAAFPDHDTQYTWAREVFRASCQEYERTYGDNEEVARIYTLIVNRASTFRGHVKDKVCNRIVETYGLVNADRVKRLLEPVGHRGDANRYCYKEFDKNPPRGLMAVPIIVHALQDVIASRSGGSTHPPPGVEFRSLFDPVPLPTIALLLTMVRYGLQRWSTGRLAQKDRTHEFRETTYKGVFTEHLRHLEDWQELDRTVTTKIRSAMYKTVICLGGFSLVDEKLAGLSDMAKENALQDLEGWTAENAGSD
ncbi:hypothetical protein BC835DRAFT_1303141 [Cytidiella melzeri]|nr:hypothetical protein BC835DRAFT_1303141 [Cytidiella melzeri]